MTATNPLTEGLHWAHFRQGIERVFLKGCYLNQELVSKGFAKVV